MQTFKLALLLFTLLKGEVQAAKKLKEIFAWNYFDFAYPTDQDRYNAMLNGDYIPANGLPVGIEIWNNKMFVTLPRWKEGVPSTLNYVDLDRYDSKSPALIPFPDWKSNEAGNCNNALTSVDRVKVDRCDRLWVLDTGTTGIGANMKNPCPYALNVFDLKTSKRLRRYQLRPEDTNPNTFIANIEVDVGAKCEDAFAYMSDELGYGLIVYSWNQDTSWRFKHGFFFPDPLAGDFNVGGINFQWDDEGIFGMILSPLQQDGYRTLFFGPLASNREFAVSTQILNNASKVDDGYHDFVALEDRGPNSHVTARAMDDTGVMFYNLVDRNAVGCWNSVLPYKPEYMAVVDSDHEGLIFPVDIKVDRNRNLWVMSDRMPIFLIKGIDVNDVNFRIYVAPVENMIKNTVCGFY
ncbi:protein yellow isoform X2 [Photinus pyralis]|uniref:Protein yellow n=2 Tax=Photinus pyralis TaxID=7054 RepID=A0A1Y1KX98_PHOPY|nr:protein yellow isoform X2 [Photinus pyralis]